MRVLVAGATGAVGRPLLKELVTAGHAVSALTRSPEKCDALRAAGAEPLQADVFDPAALQRALQRAAPDAVVHQMTALPPRIDPRRIGPALAATNRVRDEGTRRLIEAARGATRFVAQSVAFAYEPKPALHGEDDPLLADPPGGFAGVLAALRSLERQVGALTCGTVLRYGYFFGPGTVYGAGGSFREDVMHRRVPLPGAASGVFSFIHVEDAAAAVVAALAADAGAARGVFNVVDDEPAPLREWLPEYARGLGAKPPLKVPGFLARLGAGAYGVHLLLRQQGASNAKAKRQLHWSPRRSWRAGLAAAE